MSDGGSGPTVIGHQKHTYHLVDPSPWPIVGAIAAGLLTSGTVMGMHGHGWYLCVAGAVGVIMTMYVWWRDVINEATFQGYHTPVVRLGMRYGMTLFITSEVMFFSAFFWAFFSSSLFPAAGVWPPAGVKPFDPLDLPLLNTLILLLSATTVTWAHHSIIEGKRSQALQGLACTILLGMTFTSCQAIEYSRAGFTFGGNIFGATFFMATGFHGAHVIIGTIFLIVCWFRAYRGDFKPEHHFGFEAAAWYWHFVDVVWLFLYFCIYVWGGGVGAIGSE